MFTPEQIALFQRVLVHQSAVKELLQHFDEHNVDGRRCIRVNPEPANRLLEEENAAHEQHRAYHARRKQEEIMEQNMRGIRSWAPDVIEHIIAKITAKRDALSWTCPNDGRAYEFVWKNQRYLRTYSGEMWRDVAVMVGENPHPIPVLGEKVGYWSGYFISRRPPIVYGVGPLVPRYE